ncbi:MAG: VanZ family protein [Herbiconiux sp.]|uniref:VanZ family protein n=1 Tax=Herbiconiux sp. TaxID=1871186 RepID=UPI0011FEDD8F|nr:VanZ family protein [Herbiconiux sp.]TAJ49184.1 MAG: VanZ family protein [Herbiconiux sp.]
MSSLALNLLFAAVLATVTLVGVGVLVIRRRSIGAALALGTVWAVSVAFMTLRPGSGLGMRVNLVPLAFDGRGSAIDAVLNVGVFVPLGIVLVLGGVRLGPAFLIGLVTTGTIEVTQYLLDVGRTADINDIITNTTGALVGWLAAAGVRAAASASPSYGELPVRGRQPRRP